MDGEAKMGAHQHSAGSGGGAHEHAHDHHPMQQHHFDNMHQQQDASMFGMWVFLVQEVMFFGGLFVAYLVYRNKYYPAFGEASFSLRINLGLVNTMVLIASSLTMAIAVNAAQTGKKIRLIAFMLATMFLGSIFLGVKVVEYTEKFEKREVPGENFCFIRDPQAPPCKNVSEAHEDTIPLLERYASGGFGHPPGLEEAKAEPESEVAASTPIPGMVPATERQRSMPGSEIYFSLYFAMTGMHALHMIVGIGVMIWLLFYCFQGRFDATYYTPIENFGLYWHFVDIIWIYLFPLLYLINRHIHTGAH